MEDVCDKMDDYAKAKLKTNGKLIVLKMMTETGMYFRIWICKLINQY